MTSIVDLLNRIRWDREFGEGKFVIGYEDHMLPEDVLVPFDEIVFEEGDHFAFQVRNEDDRPVSIPFHRVHEVYKNGVLIWQRPKHGKRGPRP
jgi:uncharacterized protein (UPF0248 family)